MPELSLRGSVTTKGDHFTLHMHMQQQMHNSKSDTLMLSPTWQYISCFVTVRQLSMPRLYVTQYLALEALPLTLASYCTVVHSVQLMF